VLIDDGEGMLPFVSDQRAFVELARRLLGDALVDVRRIYEAPDAEGLSEGYEPPAPGVPVLALTDLGLAGRTERGMAAVIAAWQAFASANALRGSSLSALVPFPRESWPQQVAACVRLAVWDRSTTTNRARLARAGGLVR
jgi:hypothetical protein